MPASVVQSVERLGFPWRTFDPFLFCVHHDDAYPPGNEKMGPAASLEGRDLGQDFTIKDGWRMYHGQEVPGFPQHPHRGFETVTLARRGYIDHSDSLGAKARFGKGDAQWLTAGRGIVHCEMFPLVEREAPNPTELFQIWLNLPARSKMVAPHFTMLWGPHIPRHHLKDDAGHAVEVVTVAGPLGDEKVPAPPPNSWASQPGSEVAIWTIRLAPGAKWTIPAASPGVNRGLYFFAGESLDVGDRRVESGVGMRLRADVPAELVNGPVESELLMLQGRPIAEPVAQYGPFVMNTRAELDQTFADFRRTRFGGWPWPSDAPVHPREEGRFAIHADGTIDRP
jgi:redox-sensitive bicupin YhaK (pirin superfamily)